MKRAASVATLTLYVLAFVLPEFQFAVVHAQAAGGSGVKKQTTGQDGGAVQSGPDVATLLGLGPAAQAPVAGVDRPASAGLPSILNESSALSAAVMMAVGGRGTHFNEVTLAADWDGREDRVADRAVKIADFATAPDSSLTRTAVSAHTAANGFNENVYYYGDSVGNVTIGVNTNPGTVNSTSNPSVDLALTLHLPTLLNAFGTINSDSQVVVTGLCVNPVADLTSFPNVNGAFTAFSGQIGEMLYVTYTDTGGGLRLAANNILVKSGLLAFPIADMVSPAAAPPAIHSELGFPVTVGGGFGVAFSVFHNLAGCAVDDDGSVYFQQVDLTQFTGANIVKVTDTGTNQDRSLAVSGILTMTTLNPTGGLYGTASGPAAQVNRATNYSGTATTWGNVTALAAGSGNTVYAAMAASNDGTPGSGLFTNPAALGPTPSMIVSFADAVGTFSPDPGVVVADGFADPAAAGVALGAGVNNFRVFALGSGPERRAAPDTSSPVFGTTADTLKLDFQIDYSIYNGIAVDEDRKVYVVSGGTPAGVGLNPSPHVGEILLFEDRFPADRRADWIDLRGDQLPNPPVSGGNVGDGDSDRYDHIFMPAPFDIVSGAPTGLAGLSRGFLRYTNRLAPNAISPGLTLGQTGGEMVQGDDVTAGPIFFESFDPGHQAAGGDDQNPPFRGDDSDGGGFPPLAGPREGGFEFTFGGIVAGMCTAPWNAFYLNSNGNITFGAGDTDFTPSVAELLNGPPRVAGAWGDLDPNTRVGGALNTFPVQALGFAGINHFKVRYINVPRFGVAATAAGSRNTLSISLFDDGTGLDENANQALNPANPIGNNAVAFDLQEGPTDLHFTSGPAGTIGHAPRPDGSARIALEYGWMDTAERLNNFIAGYATGAGIALGEVNLGELGRVGMIGVGVESALFEQFADVDWDLRFEGNDAAASTPAGQPDLNRDNLLFFGTACDPVPLTLTVAVDGSGTVTDTGIDCPGDCSASYPSGSTVVLTATPDPGWVFSHWTGCDAPAGNVCSMFMHDNRQVAATFAVAPPAVPLQVSLSASSITTGDFLVATVTLDPSISGAVPVDAYVFVLVPGGQVYSFVGLNQLVPGIVPIASNFIPFPFTGPVLAAPLSGIPPGEYTFYAILTHAGTTTVIGTPGSASFTFTP